MNANSIESLPYRAERLRLAPTVDLHVSSARPAENGGARLLPRPADPAGHRRSADAQQFLLEISAEFVSRDHETTLKRLADRAVPFLADFCYFDVVGADGHIGRVGRAHVDSVKAGLFDLVDEFGPALGSINQPVSKALRTGRTDFVPEVTEAWMRAVATSQRHFELMRDLELRSMIAVPLIVPGLTLGVLTFCYSASSGRHYTPEDIWVAEDLAHRAALVVENSRLYHELEDAAHRKDEFLAMLGHELRNPLAPIRNGMEIIRLNGPGPVIEEITKMVERQIKHLTRLVDDLLDVSRVGHGKINLQMEPVDLRDVVALAIEMSRPLIDARKQRLNVLLSSRAVEVEGDCGRLAQVVSNLLNNSAKYSDDGACIELSVEATASQGILRVRDTGIGVEPAMLPRIFDLFTQVNSSSSRFGEGLGIGLALVRNIIELHGGCVQASSAGLGHGTEMVVHLPLLREMSGSLSGADDKPGKAMSSLTRRILVVDDNRDAADSMAILLRFAGHEVTAVYDGQAALTVAQLEEPDVVICDITMPDMSGYELARRLRQDLGLKNCLLVALSGYAQEEDQRMSQTCGFNAHLAKPVRLDTLKALLASEAFRTVGSGGE